MVDSKALTIARYHEVEDCDPLPECLRASMRHIICAHAVGATSQERVADAEDLMHMLGVHPDQAECVDYRTNHGTMS